IGEIYPFTTLDPIRSCGKVTTSGAASVLPSNAKFSSISVMLYSWYSISIPYSSSNFSAASSSAAPLSSSSQTSNFSGFSASSTSAASSLPELSSTSSSGPQAANTPITNMNANKAPNHFFIQLPSLKDYSFEVNAIFMKTVAQPLYIKLYIVFSKMQEKILFITQQ